ncbi:MAG TPA: hypothetical protein VF230_13085 [Acidimicrobiales bacterium]
MEHDVPSPSVNVTGEGDAIVVRPTGRFDDRAARLVSELVASARRACVEVVVDLRGVGPGQHAGLRLLPIAARTTVRRYEPS